jgi:hypothetical protein
MNASNQTKPNAHNVRTRKLGKLTAAQQDSLIRWLRDDKLTYAAARERLVKEFGVKVSDCALSRFWQRHVLPAGAESSTVDSDILLDVVIKSIGPVRLIVKKKGISLEY